MKKVLSLILTLVLLIGSVALAEIDLTGMSFNELRILYEQVQEALFATREGNGVLVGRGYYIVGEDIPEGKWTVKLPDAVSRSYICIYAKFNAEVGEGEKIVDYMNIWDETYDEDGYEHSVTLSLKNGQVVFIKNGETLFYPADKLGFGFFK